jgi:hypothetical protein
MPFKTCLKSEQEKFGLFFDMKCYKSDSYIKIPDIRNLGCFSVPVGWNRVGKSWAGDGVGEYSMEHEDLRR